MDLHEISSHLEAHLRMLRDRNVQAAAGREFTAADLVEVRIEHAEEVLSLLPAAADQLVQIARIGRKAQYRVHLVFDRELRLLHLADFANAILRDLACDEGSTVTITDTKGTTLANLRAKASRK
jgi:hypothetical protein